MTAAIAALTPAPFWILMTLVAWRAALHLQQLARGHMLVNPIVLSIMAIIGLIMVSGQTYADYARATYPITVWIGPATVSLAIPIHTHLALIRRAWLPIAAALVVGSSVAIASGWGIARMLGASPGLLLSILPKSVTAPVAMVLGEQMGGSAALAMTAVLIAGITGSMLAPLLPAMTRCTDSRATGFAAGLGAHNFGIAKALAIDDRAGAFAILGMACNALMTAQILLLVSIMMAR